MGKKILFGLLGIFFLIQFIPVDRNNPEIKNEPQWDSPQTRELTKNACFDCHSNQTDYPWYSYLAPMSWIIKKHISEGREQLNFSEWNNEFDAEEIADEIREGEMPLFSYQLLHSHARLTKEQTDSLILGLTKTLSARKDNNGSDYDED